MSALRAQAGRTAGFRPSGGRVFGTSRDQEKLHLKCPVCQNHTFLTLFLPLAFLLRRVARLRRQEAGDHGGPHLGARGDGPDPFWGQILSDEAWGSPRDPVCMLLCGRLNTGVSANWAYMSTKRRAHYERRRVAHATVVSGRRGRLTVCCVHRTFFRRRLRGGRAAWFPGALRARSLGRCVLEFLSPPFPRGAGDSSNGRDALALCLVPSLARLQLVPLGCALASTGPGVPRPDSAPAVPGVRLGPSVVRLPRSASR